MLFADHETRMIARQQIIAHHLVWTAYGWWLPNDPRGSMSSFIQSDLIAELGEIHYGRKRIQPAGWEIRQFYEDAPTRLQHELLLFDKHAIQLVAESFATTIHRNGWTVYACAIMPDHVHMLVRVHRDRAEKIIEKLQSDSRWYLREKGTRPKEHPVWGGPGWVVFQHSPDDIERTIRYITSNPIKQRLPEQSWPFVTPYDGWPRKDYTRL